ncbi:MAG: hypothetical protein ABIW32_09665 [Terrimesophilobacter sp.]
MADGVETQWVHPKELGRQARRNPSHYSALLGLQANHVPFFGATTPAIHHLVLSKERATG